MPTRSRLMAWMMGFAYVSDDSIYRYFGHDAEEPLQSLLDLGLVRKCYRTGRKYEVVMNKF